MNVEMFNDCRHFDALPFGWYGRYVPRSKKTKPPAEEAKDPPERKRTTIYLPNQLYKALKIYAVQNEKEMSEVVAEGLRKLGLEG